VKKVIKVTAEEPLLALAEGIVYAQRPEWCDATSRDLKVSLIRRRQFFEYDKRVVSPVIVWICGGAWTEMNRNVWIPELTWFAKRGYVVASVDYSVTARTRFPQQIVDIKEAIRFLRAHAKELGLDPGRFAVMGESAGGYLSALAGAAGSLREYDTGAYLDQSSAVQAAVPWYPVTDPSSFTYNEFIAEALPRGFEKFIDITKLVDAHTPPYFFIHGTKDSQVDKSQSEKMYDVLQAKGIESELVIIEGAEHADIHFVQGEIKQMILDFLNKHLAV
jgi:acetyl esterase/lipase